MLQKKEGLVSAVCDSAAHKMQITYCVIWRKASRSIRNGRCCISATESKEGSLLDCLKTEGRCQFLTTGFCTHVCGKRNITYVRKGFCIFVFCSYEREQRLELWRRWGLSVVCLFSPALCTSRHGHWTIQKLNIVIFVFVSVSSIAATEASSEK